MLVSLAVIWVLVIPAAVVALACLRAQRLRSPRRVVTAQWWLAKRSSVTSPMPPHQRASERLSR
jgi:hypothetical protein